jgi:hypothetical protein
MSLSVTQECTVVQEWNKEVTLKAIRIIESGDGKNVDHEVITRGIDTGTKAFGKYGLTISLIKDVVFHSPRLMKKHATVLDMNNEELNQYMSYNHELEEEVASRFYDRIVKEVGASNPDLIYLCWLNGIVGAQQYLTKHELKDHAIANKVLISYYKEMKYDEKTYEASTTN